MCVEALFERLICVEIAVYADLLLHEWRIHTTKGFKRRFQTNIQPLCWIIRGSSMTIEQYSDRLHLAFGKTRARILVALFGNAYECKEFTAEELREMLDYSNEAVRKALKELKDQGIVRARKAESANRGPKPEVFRISDNIGDPEVWLNLLPQVIASEEEALRILERRNQPIQWDQEIKPESSILSECMVLADQLHDKFQRLQHITSESYFSYEFRTIREKLAEISELSLDIAKQIDTGVEPESKWTPDSDSFFDYLRGIGLSKLTTIRKTHAVEIDKPEPSDLRKKMGPESIFKDLREPESLLKDLDEPTLSTTDTLQTAITQAEWQEKSSGILHDSDNSENYTYPLGG